MGQTIKELTPAHHQARGCSAHLVSEYLQRKDHNIPHETIRPLAALARRIVETRMGLRSDVNTPGAPLAVIFETTASEPIDEEAQLFLGHLATSGPDEKELTVPIGTVTANRFCLDRGLGFVYRVHFGEDYTEGRNVHYLVPTANPAEISPTDQV